MSDAPPRITHDRPSGRSPGRLLVRVAIQLVLALLVTAAADDALAVPNPCFVDIGAGLPGLEGGAVAWGDYDNDGDLDILFTGWTGAPTARVYQNSGGPTPTFSDIGAGLTGVNYSSAAWGDYDNDGDLDILITGRSGPARLAIIYRNDGGSTFTDIGAGLPGVEVGTGIWGDYDNDGDLDILLAGYDGANPITKIFNNSGGPGATFTDVFSLTGILYGTAAWGDYDRDGDLDLVVIGRDSATQPTSKLYRNNGGPYPTFSGINAGFVPVLYGSVAWGDYDSDSDLDLLLTGDQLNGSPVTKIYRNNGGQNPTFSDAGAALAPVKYGQAIWGDCDNDGDLDILLNGFDNVTPVITRVYLSSGGPTPTFTDLSAALPAVNFSSAAWGDYDNDNDLDLLLTGISPSISRIYRTDCVVPNNNPQAPTNLTAVYNGSRFVFSWSPALDSQTFSSGLSYNLRIGTSPGADDILSAMADPGTGYRRIPAMGNTGQKTTWEVALPGLAPYYWSVQTIDPSFAGSAFAPEEIIAQSGVDDSPSPATGPLWSAGPNPFSTATSIGFSQTARGRVTLDVYDLAGRHVRQLVNEEMEAGAFTKSWDGRDDDGKAVPSGVYFVRLEASDGVANHRMIMVR